MKAERITEWDGAKLFRPIDIFWWFNKEYAGMSLTQRVIRCISNIYYAGCWWLSDHLNLFNPISEGERFSWRKLKGIR